MKSKRNQGLGLLAIATILMLAVIPFISAGTTDEKSTPSTATIDIFVEISLSSELGTGIAFGNLNPNTNDNNATKNYNATNETEYYVTAGAVNSVDLDLCIKDNAPLTKGVDTIPNAGYTYDFSATNDLATPSLPGTAITTGYVKTGHTVLEPSEVSYARFYLDVPGAQHSGAYNNTVSINGIETGQSC